VTYISATKAGVGQINYQTFVEAVPIALKEQMMTVSTEKTT